MKLFVESVVRKQRTRALRRVSPVRHRFKQHICGGAIRLIRNRSAVIDENVLEAHRPELEKLQAGGIIEIHEGGPNGRLFDFTAGDPPVTEEVKDDEPKDEEEVTEAAPAEVEDAPVAAEEVVQAPAEEPVSHTPEPRPKKKGRGKRKRS